MNSWLGKLMSILFTFILNFWVFLHFLATASAREDDHHPDKLPKLRGHEDILVGKGHPACLFLPLNKPNNVHGSGACCEEVGLVLNRALQDARPDATPLLNDRLLVSAEL